MFHQILDYKWVVKGDMPVCRSMIDKKDGSQKQNKKDRKTELNKDRKGREKEIRNVVKVEMLAATSRWLQ